MSVVVLAHVLVRAWRFCLQLLQFESKCCDVFDLNVIEGCPETTD